MIRRGKEHLTLNDDDDWKPSTKSSHYNKIKTDDIDLPMNTTHPTKIISRLVNYAKTAELSEFNDIFILLDRASQELADGMLPFISHMEKIIIKEYSRVA